MLEELQFEITPANAGVKQEVHLLGSAEPHPHLEPSEEQLDHLVVLQVHGRTVQLCPRTPVVPQQHGGDQPQERQPEHGEARVEHQRGKSVGGAGRRQAWMPREQSPSASAQQRQTGGAHAVVAVGDRVEELEGKREGKFKMWGYLPSGISDKKYSVK